MARSPRVPRVTIQVSRETHEVLKGAADRRGMKLWFVADAMARAWLGLSPEQQSRALMLVEPATPSSGDSRQSDHRPPQKQRRKANAA